MTIPADMVNAELSEKVGGTVVSIRDMLLALGASDDSLRDYDERQEILAREPWRTANLKFVPLGDKVDGCQIGYTKGKIDWTGTRFKNQVLVCAYECCGEIAGQPHKETCVNPRNDSLVFVGWKDE